MIPAVPFRTPILDGQSVKIEQSDWVLWLRQLADAVNALQSGVGSQWANVLDFSPPSTATGDWTATVARAVASLPDEGGTVFFPGGRTYAMNYTLIRPKIRFLGSAIGKVSVATAPAGIRAFDPTQYAVTVGDDSALLPGIVFDTLEFNGQGTDFYGLKLTGGCIEHFYNNCTFQSFTKKALTVESGATLPTLFINFVNTGIQLADTAAAEHGIHIRQAAVGTFVEEINFIGLRLSGVSSGLAIEVAGSQNSNFLGWLQVSADGTGVLLSKPFTVTPRFNSAGYFKIDSDNPAWTLLSTNFAGPVVTEEVVYGMVGIDGVVDLNGTTDLNESPMHIPNLSRGVNMKNIGSFYLAESSDPSDTAVRLSPTSSNGRLTAFCTRFITSQRLRVTTMDEYANNAAAIVGGLSVGDFYRLTGTGDVQVVI